MPAFVRRDEGYICAYLITQQQHNNNTNIKFIFFVLEKYVHVTSGGWTAPRLEFSTTGSGWGRPYGSLAGWYAV